jgi:hypothetical protein
MIHQVACLEMRAGRLDDARAHRATALQLEPSSRDTPRRTTT